MGLDSIELIIEFENFFDTPIEDREAEQLRTLQEVVDLISFKRMVTTNRCVAFNEFSAFITNQLLQHALLPNNLDHTVDILPYINLKDKVIVSELQTILELEVEVYQPMSFPFWHLISNKKEEYISLSQFVEAMAILNYTQLYPKKLFASQQEIYLSVALLTYHKSGVSVYELGRDKSFTNDLGID